MIDLVYGTHLTNVTTEIDVLTYPSFTVKINGRTQTTKLYNSLGCIPYYIFDNNFKFIKDLVNT